MLFQMKNNTQVSIGITLMSISFMIFCLIASCNTADNEKVVYKYAVEYCIPDSLKDESRQWITKTTEALPSHTEVTVYDVEIMANEQFGVRTEGLEIFRGMRIDFVPFYQLNPEELKIMNELKNNEGRIY
jgi:hypothetical protein